MKIIAEHHFNIPGKVFRDNEANISIGNPNRVPSLPIKYKKHALFSAFLLISCNVTGAGMLMPTMPT
jgi:hypothetical protein